MKDKYYSFDNILERGLKVNAKYYMIIGERSNGKTYQAKLLGLNGNKKNGIKGFIQDGSQFAILRRYQEDFRGKRGASLFNDFVEQGLIKKWTKGKWDSVYYRSQMWYLSKYDETLDKDVHDSVPFAYGFALAQMEHDKSTSYPNINKIIFDEFLSRQMYLVDEFQLFCNTISTIVRDRDDVSIFLLGNSVSYVSPYFKEMGIDVKKIKQGEIIIYKYGESDLRVIVEYTDTAKHNKKASDVYFAFNNPKLQMIKNGGFELGIYPHLPVKYLPKHVKYVYYVINVFYVLW